jgi:glycopeptide antibiotics resistance protein
MPSRLRLSAARPVLLAAAWLMLALIFASTVVPIELRPHSPFSANWERLLSFFAVGLLFTLAYPRRLLLVVVLLVGAAIGFEVLQLFAGTRHAHVRDMLVKLAGAVTGVGLGAVFTYVSGVMRR